MPIKRLNEKIKIDNIGKWLTYHSFSNSLILIGLTLNVGGRFANMYARETMTTS